MRPTKPGDPPLTKSELVAMLRATRDLGPDYDEHIADQILERTQNEPQQQFPRRRRVGPLGSVMPLMGISIPLLAIAGGIAHTPGILAVLGFDAVVVIMLTKSPS